MEIVWIALAFIIGGCLGILLHKWISQRNIPSGTIHITRSRGRILYTLELEEYPEEIAFKKRVVFTVDSPFESPDRD